MHKILLRLLSIFFVVFATNAQTEFITTWSTSNPGISGNNQITIPTYPGETYDYAVNWGDGTSDAAITGDITHTYAASGTYTVSISGIFPRIYFNYETGSRISADQSKLLAIEQWGDIAWSSMSGSFYGCVNMDVRATDVPDLANVTSTAGMFRECSALEYNASFNDWDVSNVTDMSTMFFQASLFNSPLNDWDVSKVETFGSMFLGATNFNQPLNKWDVSSARNLGAMFLSASAFNQYIGNWDVSSVENMAYLFSSAVNFDQDISNWNVSKVTEMRVMFQNAINFNQDLSSWDVGNVWNMSGMFRDASSFDHDIGNWDVSKVTHMNWMFSRAEAFNKNISNWNVGNVTDMAEMFMDAKSFDQPIGNWNVGKVTDMSSMFEGAIGFDQNLGNWNVSLVNDMSFMFRGCTLSVQNYDSLLQGWNSLSSLRINVSLDAGSSKFCQGAEARQNLIDTYGWVISDSGKRCTFITTWNTNNPGTSADNQITIPTWTGNYYNYEVDWGDGTSNTGVTGDITHTYAIPGTYQVSIYGQFPSISFRNQGDAKKLLSVDQWGNIQWGDMMQSFKGCSNMDVLATDAPDLRYTSTISGMFANCTSLMGSESFNEWDVSSVTWMTEVFNGASGFNQDIGSWNVGNVENMGSMFMLAASFNQDIGNWDVRKVNSMQAMFQGAKSFNRDISKWDVSNVEIMLQMFTGAKAFNQNIGGWNVGAVTEMYSMFWGAESFNQDIGGWNVYNVLNMSRMFEFATSFDQDLGDWQIGANTELDYLFSNAGLSTKNYDSLLNGWSNQALPYYVNFNAGKSQFCIGEASRQKLIDTFGWTINDLGKECSGSYFKTTWKTDNPGVSDDNQISIPTYPGETYNYFVDWGDGTSASGVIGGVTHTYAEAGTYQVSIVGDFPRIYFNNYALGPIPEQGDENKIISIDQWGTLKWTSMDGAFAGCSNLDMLATDLPDLLNIDSVIGMFRFCKNLKGNNSMEDWNVSSVNIFAAMFDGAILFNQDIGNWDVSNATSMGSMFSGAKTFNQNLNSWDVSNVIHFDSMFASASNFNQPLNTWNVDNAETMFLMFAYSTSFNQEVGNWNLSKVYDIRNIFSGAESFNQDISEWNLESATNFSGMFALAQNFNQDLSSWDTSHVIDMGSMFLEATSFNQNLGSWNIENVTELNNFLEGSKLSFENYDLTLKGWSEQNIKSNINFHVGSSQYCEASDARQFIIDTYGWSITDGGKVPLCGEDNDADEVPDHKDACLETLPGTAVNANGCDYIANDAIKVLVLTPGCSGSADGVVEIGMDTTGYLLDITIEGEDLFRQSHDVPSGSGFRIEDLPVGLYHISVSIPEVLYEQVYGARVNELNAVTGKRTSLDTKTGKVTYSVIGSTNYAVMVNDQTMDYEFENSGPQTITIDGLQGQTNIKISGANDCQGNISDDFFIGKHFEVFPTITSAYVNIFTDGDITAVKVYSVDGRLVRELGYNHQDKILDLTSLNPGLYIVQIRKDGQEEIVKLIKR